MIEKQQKEIEEQLEIITYLYKDGYDELKEKYIPKEAIREKIEYYKKQNNELDDFTCEIDALEELLGE